MEIRQLNTGDPVLLALRGRLDATWADHTKAAIEACVRSGAHRIVADLQEVSYISSAGIRVLVYFYKQLHAIQGRFGVTRPSTQVRIVLEQSGLDRLFVDEGETLPQTAAGGPAPGAGPRSPEPLRRLAAGPAEVELWSAGEGVAPARVTVVGEPGAFARTAVTAASLRGLPIGPQRLALGHGALGEGFEDCRDRLGEFVAAAGAAAGQPPGGAFRPDFVVAERHLVPTIQAVQAVVVDGALPWHLRFESSRDRGAVGLPDLLEAALQAASTDRLAVVLVGEIAGLVGAALARSPAAEVPAAPRTRVSFPEIRDWLTFTHEPAFRDAVALAAGVVTRGPPPPGLAAAGLRPLGREGRLHAHFHAAVVSYRPLRRGRIELAETVANLFDNQHLFAVLHLVHDDRPGVGAGGSEFWRGAVWAGRLDTES